MTPEILTESRRNFIRAMGLACAALAVPLAWKRAAKPVRFYAFDRIVMTIGGMEIKGFTSSVYDDEPQMVRDYMAGKSDLLHVRTRTHPIIGKRTP